MLRSVVVCCGPHAIGVVLTGTMDDGASGLHAISKCGGIAVVQDPDDAAFPEMPLRALNQANPQHVVSLSEMPTLLESLVHQPPGDPMPIPERLWEIEEGDLIRYRCHVGHALSSQAMSAGITDKVQEALYVALRALDEQAALTDKLLTRASAQGRNRMAADWARKKEETNRQRDVIQKTINHADEIAFESMTQSETED